MTIPQGPYKPIETEEKLLKQWLDSGVYSPEYAEKLGAKETFSITMPPPNANGNLHLGHVSGYAYQDLMGRYQRMQGKKVLLFPGKDHAGIQTEVVYEKELDKKGTSKQEIGREEFYKQTYDFCMENGKNARAQEQRIGVSADFDRELFTLDPKIVDDVLQTFLMMYDDKLIYRGKRLINWCPRCQSALADIDTEYEDATSKFFYFKYAFTEPEEKAIELKHQYEGHGKLWKVKDREQIDGAPVSYLLGETHEGIKMLGVGYDDVPAGNEVNGKIIGIQMRLDGDFHLVIASLDFDGNIDDEVNKAFLEMIKLHAGAHILLFDEHPDDSHYTNGFILGTVRPETKFGDTAIAADPRDERYKPFVGNQFDVQTLTGIATINFIADKAVDAAFGTGIVKVTPAHAPEDWDIASRHPKEAFPEKQVIDFHGKLNHLTGHYEGKTVDEAREMMVSDMWEKGMLIYLDEKYKNRVQVCERCKSRIEPLISHQWFVDTRPLKAKAKKFIEDDVTTIIPEGMQNVYMNWMDSDEDWCITRQLWWGYRIPVWYKGGKSEYITDTGEVREMIGDTVIEKPEDYEGLMKVQMENPGEGWEQDPDVLDTWFSSGQWPFITLNAREGDLKEFYPTQVMETGWDILIFWVTRMMMLSPYRAEKAGYSPEQQAPFANVYLHGLVLDKNGKKMSKSKGNGIDPTDMINKYGADALRMSFFVGSSPGQNIRLYEDKVSSFGRFLNKVWNASKFVMMNLEGVDVDSANLESLQANKLAHKSNQELLDHLTALKDDVTRLIDTFQFGVAAQLLYNEFWHTFADIHIEAAKPHVYTFKDKETGEIKSEPEADEKAETQQVLLLALQEYLKMMHPFMPFITEELWSFVPKAKDQSNVLMYEPW